MSNLNLEIPRPSQKFVSVCSLSSYMCVGILNEFNEMFYFACGFGGKCN